LQGLRTAANGTVRLALAKLSNGRLRQGDDLRMQRIARHGRQAVHLDGEAAGKGS
jgi:hypothetical protein